MTQGGLVSGDMRILLKHTTPQKQTPKNKDEGEKIAILATGLHNHMNRVEFIICLVFDYPLCVVHVAHKALQSTNYTLADAINVTDNLRANVGSKKIKMHGMVCGAQ